MASGTLNRIWQRMVADAAPLLISLGVIMTMMSGSAGAAPHFNLQPPEHYFSNPKSLALLGAARDGDVMRAKQLVADGADPNDDGPKDNKYNRLRLLHYAIAANDTRAVRILVGVGADPEVTALGFGRSFVFARTLENIQMLSVLLDLRPISTLSKDTVQYIMFESVTHWCRPCLELFLERGAPIDFPDDAGYTVMMSAIDAQDYDTAAWLLEKGASVHIMPPSGVTPAYSVQYELRKFKVGSPTYNKVLHLKEMMEARGAKFPATDPREIRERNAARGKPSP